MILRLLIKPQECIGCRACEMACAFSHGKDGQPAASRCQTMTVGRDEYVPMMCLQCDHAACVQSCPVSAITMNEATRTVLVDNERCIRCMACTVACPFGNMHFDPIWDGLDGRPPQRSESAGALRARDGLDGRPPQRSESAGAPPAARGLIHKCDLCAGCGDYPRCAMFCPTKCLSVERVDETGSV